MENKVTVDRPGLLAFDFRTYSTEDVGNAFRELAAQVRNGINKSDSGMRKVSRPYKLAKRV